MMSRVADLSASAHIPSGPQVLPLFRVTIVSETSTVDALMLSVY